MWACFNKANSSFVAFVENDGDDEDDNHIFSGSKLSVTLSESTRCHGLTIFENEEVIKFSPLAFYSKIRLINPNIQSGFLRFGEPYGLMHMIVLKTSKHVLEKMGE